MVKQISSNAELQQTLADNSGKLIVIDFFATWCGPCKAIAPFFEDLSKKCANAVFIKVDVDNEDLEEEVGKFNIQGMPTFVFMKEGKEVDRFSGADKKVLEEKVQKYSS